MATIRRFCCNDLLHFASVNLDNHTNTGTMSLYLTWFARWPDYSHVAVAPGNRIIGYILGITAEVRRKDLCECCQHWQGLAMDVCVASEYRRQKLATKLMQFLDRKLVEYMLSSDPSPRDRKYYLCLYVPASNIPARKFFEQLGYEVIGEMPNFHEDTLEMRKELSEEEPELF